MISSPYCLIPLEQSKIYAYVTFKYIYTYLTIKCYYLLQRFNSKNNNTIIITTILLFSFWFSCNYFRFATLLINLLIPLDLLHFLHLIQPPLFRFFSSSHFFYIPTYFCQSYCPLTFPSLNHAQVSSIYFLKFYLLFGRS